MTPTTAAERRRLESLPRAELEQYQLRRLNALLNQALPSNQFYAQKLARMKQPIESLAEFAQWPFTFKEELMGPASGGDTANNHTWPRERYSRFHQTSGASGRPMVVLDMPEDWQWVLECWQYVLDAAGVDSGDRVLMAFSFGPHIGFWGAYEAFCQRGALVIPTGGMNSLQRLELVRHNEPTVVCCTPSYALHLAEVAGQHDIDIAQCGVRILVLAGEPGGSVPAVRGRLEQLWNAQVHDHCGATEVGPWGFGEPHGQGLHVIESEYIAEFLSLATGGPAEDGEEAELVITNLGRIGCPVLRYRTGDVVRPTWLHSEANRFVFLAGGVLGRNDDMLVVRGVNVFPSSIDHILRSFPEVVEYRATVYKVSEMDRLRIEIEDRLEQPDRILQEFKLRIGLRVEVESVPLGSLPRFEGKGKRFIDNRELPR
ncbi:MAG TPA: AMP-binding protein [Pirellulales bacterium]|jgi:phenylacetate-CoA ligase|nr:AMP-binding protein [Pirellulales bacterium]